MRATTGAGAVHGVPVHRFPSPLRRLVSLLGVVALLIAAPALAEKRVALVIGNAAYKHAPALANPKNDAEGMAAALKRLKFEVLAGTDLDKPGMERLLRRFADAIESADVALVFYAGHGLQVNGRNYLVPVDAKLEKESDLRFDAIPLDDIQGLMETSQRVNILMLDACRDNPLARNLARSMGTRSTSIGRGLGETKAGIGTLVVYATQPGNVALDGEARNSPFTAALLKHIESPGLEIRQVLTRVRNDVITVTRDKQVPWDSSSLRGDFFLVAAAPQPPATPQAAPPQTSEEVAFWQGIRDSRSAGDFKAYLERWPSGLFAVLARARIAEIERAAAEESRRADEQRADAERKARVEAERKSRDEARQQAEAKRNQADSVGRIAAQRLDRAKIALKQNKYFDSRRLTEEGAALAKEAVELSPESTVAQSATRDLAAFRRELDARIQQRAETLVREARTFIAQKKFAEAERRLVEAEQIASASTVAARRELEAAQGRAEDDAKKKADDEAKKKAEDEKKKADEAKPAAPDHRKQGQIANSSYAPERKRGLVAFAHKKTQLEPGAIAALEKLAGSLQGQKDYKVTLVAATDRSEGSAAELQALSRARLAAIQQWLGAKGVATPAIRTAIGPARGEGPEYRTVALAADITPEKKPDAPAADSGAPSDLRQRLAGSEWRGMASGEALKAQRRPNGYNTIVRLDAAGNVRLIASSANQMANHASVAEDTGAWSVSGTRVCIALKSITDGQQQCYAATLNSDGSVTLAGAGLLAGARFVK